MTPCDVASNTRQSLVVGVFYVLFDAFFSPSGCFVDYAYGQANIARHVIHTNLRPSFLELNGIL
jgi:hypothetical protein